MAEPTKYDRLRAAIAKAANELSAAEVWAANVSDLSPFGALSRIGSALSGAGLAIEEAEAALDDCEEEDDV